MLQWGVRLVRYCLVLLALGLAACSTSAPRQTQFQESLGSQVSSREIRIRTTEFAMTFSQTVEIAADSILRLTADRRIARNALLWKSYSVPAIYRSATLPDPLMAWIDSRVLTYQMRDYFETGMGKDLFGDLQPLAVEGTRFIEGHLERAIELSGQKTDPELEGAIRQFAAENPLTNPYFFRPSPVDLLAKYLGQDQLSGLQAVGSMTELMEELSMRLNTYTEILPRAGRWQAELMLAELADPERAAIYLDILNRIEALDALNEFLVGMPDLVEEQRDILLEAVDYQRVAFEEALERYVAGATDDSAPQEARPREGRIKPARTGNRERKGADRRPVNRTKTESERERDAGPTAESILVRRAQAGDTAAFGELVSAYMHRCYYAALGMVGSPQDAEDLSQEAFVRAFRARARLDPERPFYPWLYQILRRLCYNFTRDTSSRRRKLERAGWWLVAEATTRAAGDDPERVRATDELRDRLEDAIAELPPAQREVFVLKEFEGLKYREIAELLDVPIGTVMSRLYAARQRLAQRLEGLE
jgi:RNA polymerase sigma-70 factor (ECF subfamily)